MNELERLRQHILAALEHGARQFDLPQIDRAIEGLQGAIRSENDVDCPAVVTDLLSRAEALSTSEDVEVLAAIQGAAHRMRWAPSYQHHDEPDIVTLRTGYFVAPLLGPIAHIPAPFASEQASIYLTVQAPRLLYPSHVHKAPELYRVLAGTADWQMGSRPFSPEPPGTWIVHPSGTRHAMRTKAEPLVSMAIWTADLRSEPVIVRD
ncbi:MAG: dimethylsulfonioproprionate lyase family protein [Acidimicrobiales bacterium]